MQNIGHQQVIFYYQPKPISGYDLKLMRLIDELYIDHPYRGSRSMRNQLKGLGYKKVNRKKVQRLMRMMGIQAVYPKPRPTIPHPEHKVYPYLLRNLTIDHPNQGMGFGYYVCSHEIRFYVFDRHHGLA